jgi:1-acyl-sn-glycerol-3-phosphate acyltransferase
VLTRKFLCTLGIYRIVEISGLDHLNGHRPAVVVANHRSRIDAPVLLGFVRNCGVLIKEHYARMPLYSSFVKHLDFVSVQPGNLSSLQRALEQSRGLAGRGKSLVVFPEGTRAPGPRLRPFQDIAFRIAQHNAIPVIAAVIHTSAPFMSVRRGSSFPPLPMKMTIRFLPPLYPQAAERSSQFAARVQQQIAEHLRELDKGTAWEQSASPSVRTLS